MGLLALITSLPLLVVSWKGNSCGAAETGPMLSTKRCFCWLFNRARTRSRLFGHDVNVKYEVSITVACLVFWIRKRVLGKLAIRRTRRTWLRFLEENLVKTHGREKKYLFVAKNGLAQGNVFHTPPNDNLRFERARFNARLPPVANKRLHTARPCPAGYLSLIHI